MVYHPYSLQDIDIARSKFNRDHIYDTDGNDFFSRFSPAYIVSNENLKREVMLTQNAKNVLTVAGSGDQALYYKMAGAKNVDTFDISFCAHALQDIKTTAIGKLKHTEYFVLLENLYQTGNAPKIPIMSKILPLLPKDTLDFLNDMRDCYIFRRGINPLYLPWLLFRPTRNEYKKMRLCVPPYFNFIWSNVLVLHTQLYDKYDVINLSNIFSYMEQEEKVQTIESLGPYLNIGGHIVLCDVFHNPVPELENFRVHKRLMHLSWYKEIMTLQKIK